MKKKKSSCRSYCENVPELLDIEEIKKLYPDEWVLLGNPVREENNINPIAGIPLYHGRDKREVCYLGREKKVGCNRYTLFYTGTFKPMRRIASVFSRSKL